MLRGLSTERSSSAISPARTQLRPSEAQKESLKLGTMDRDDGSPMGASYRQVSDPDSTASLTTKAIGTDSPVSNSSAGSDSPRHSDVEFFLNARGKVPTVHSAKEATRSRSRSGRGSPRSDTNTRKASPPQLAPRFSRTPPTVDTYPKLFHVSPQMRGQR